MKAIFHIGLIIVLAACQKPAVYRSQNLPDYKAYFEAEIKRLKTDKIVLRKTIVSGAEVYTNETAQPDWQNELAVFSENAAIKPREAGQLVTDSAGLITGGYIVSVTATGEGGSKTIETVKNSAGQTERITILINRRGSIGNSDLTLTYLPGKGYDIMGVIQSRIGRTQYVDIHAERLN